MLKRWGGIYTGNLLKEKASPKAKEINYKDFRASNGWLFKFNKKYGIPFKTLSGEAINKGAEDYADFFHEVNRNMDEYGEEKIYNCDKLLCFLSKHRPKV